MGPGLATVLRRRYGPDGARGRSCRSLRTPDADTHVMGPRGSALVDVLRQEGYRVVGPTVRDGAIVLDEIASADELPHGWTAHHEAATYRVERRDDDAVFGWAVGPHSWKQELMPSRVRLWRAAAADGDGTGDRGGAAARPAAGAPRRPLLRPARDRDPGPRLPRGPLRRARLRAPSRGGLRRGRQLRRARRHVLLHVDGNGPACGERLRPRSHRGHRERRHRFLVEVGSERGREILARLPVTRRRATTATPRPR